MEKKPSVFPSKEQPSIEKIQEYENKKKIVTSEIYDKAAKDNAGWKAIEQMKNRTEEQLRLRDEMIRKSTQPEPAIESAEVEPFTPKPAAPSYNTNTPESLKESIKKIEPDNPNKVLSEAELNRIEQLSQPDYDSPFDLIPVPSEGKLYGGGEKSLKVAYLTTMDEDILTSPNLLNSGLFLEVLINRKLIEPKIRYRNLHPADRNAIMIWLRATSYGEMYPVTLLDELDEAFDTEINLNSLKYKKLGAEPDENGLFDYKFELSGDTIKFKLLSVGDNEAIEAQLLKEKNEGEIINNKNTYVLQTQIVEVNGNKDKTFINNYVKKLRLMDASKFRDYVERIDCNIDLRVNVGTPGGGSVSTFLPLNTKFFWPNL